MDRRDFLKFSAAAAAFACLAPPAVAEMRNGMPYRTLGKTGENVSLLCLGGAHIGFKPLTDEQSIALMRHAVDEGVNFFDNAWAYNDGRSEILMGRALKDGYREKVFLMTKHQGRDAATAQEFLDTSLKRLDVDVIDLWQFHEVVHPKDPGRIYSEGALEVALRAKEQGKIRYIGFTGHHLTSTHLEMIEKGFAWDTVQMPLNIFDYHFRSFQQKVVPAAVEKNMGIIAMKTMGGGGLLESQAVTPEECLRYAMNLPVSTVCSGMDSMEKLKKNIATAKSFKPLGEPEVAALREKAKALAADGKYEAYKTAWHLDMQEEMKEQGLAIS